MTGLSSTIYEMIFTEIKYIYIYWINCFKNNSVGNKFRLVTAMHRNGPLPQVMVVTWVTQHDVHWHSVRVTPWQCSEIRRCLTSPVFALTVTLGVDHIDHSLSSLKPLPQWYKKNDKHHGTFLLLFYYYYFLFTKRLVTKNLNRTRTTKNGHPTHDHHDQHHNINQAISACWTVIAAAPMVMRQGYVLLLFYYYYLYIYYLMIILGWSTSTNGGIWLNECSSYIVSPAFG